MTGLTDFHTREVANEGIKLPLSLPDGKKTEHYLIIRGIDSDEFRRANIKQQRELMNLSQLSDEEREHKLEHSQTELVASLVAGWSFVDEFNQENLINWLKNAPQIADMIDRIASQRGLFIKKKPVSSSSLPSSKSSSQSRSKAPASRTKRTPGKSKKPLAEK